MNGLKWLLTLFIIAACIFVPNVHLQAIETLYKSEGSIQTMAPTNEQGISNTMQAVSVAATDPFKEHVREWLAVLALEKNFTDWQNAEWISYPIGPGTHTLLVSVFKNGQELGYLVIGLTTDGGYQLLEYGSGDQPLFGLSALHQTLMRYELLPPLSFTSFIQQQPVQLERMQYEFLYIWRVSHGTEINYFDAKTAEKLPDTVDLLLSQPGRVNTSSLVSSPEEILHKTAIISRMQLPDFDPLDHAFWIKGTPLSIPTMDTLLPILTSQNSVVYTVKWNNGMLVYPYAITGQHTWTNGNEFIRLEQNGSRYLLLSELVRLGFFYVRNLVD